MCHGINVQHDHYYTSAVVSCLYLHAGLLSDGRQASSKEQGLLYDVVCVTVIHERLACT